MADPARADARTADPVHLLGCLASASNRLVRQPVERFRLHIGDAPQRRVRLLPARTFCPRFRVLFGHKSRQLLRRRRIDQLIDRNTFAPGTFAKLLVQPVVANSSHSRDTSDLVPKLRRRQPVNTELPCGSEITAVMRDDSVTSCSHREFQEHVLIGIRKAWTPKKEHRLLLAHGAEKVNHIPHRRPPPARCAGLPHQHLLILQDHRNGHRDVETPGTHGAKQRN